MTRLLFAAARGARIQALYDKWETEKFVTVLDLQDPRYDYRIHPEDEHLQYGPISSALREFAEKGREPYTVSGYAAVGMFNYECWYPFVMESEFPHAQMFALILAEALADEGM